MNHLTETEAFRRAAGLPVADTQTIPSKADMELNMALMYEELSEYADACGLRRTFQEMVLGNLDMDYYNAEINRRSIDSPTDTNKVDPVEMLDALADMQVILDGAVMVSGFQEVFPAACSEVFRSNMSKFTDDIDVAARSSVDYHSKGVAVTWGAVGVNKWALRRTSDGKLLKPLTYSPPVLSSFIQIQ